MKTAKNHQPIPAWSAFCEAMGTRCTHVDGTGARCENGVTTGDRCAYHQTLQPSAPSTLTLAQRRQQLTAAGIIIRKTEADDYRVNYRGASERYACYESDMLAAVETGEAMRRDRPAVIKADIRKGGRQ